MVEEIQAIKSLDELEQGEIVGLEKHRSRQFSFIVESIGEIPEHEKEVLLRGLYPPSTPSSEVRYDSVTVRESELESVRILKTGIEKKNYEGWQYRSENKTIKKVE